MVIKITKLKTQHCFLTVNFCYFFFIILNNIFFIPSTESDKNNV